MKLGGYQIIDLSGASYTEEGLFVLPSDAGFEKIMRILKSGNKNVLVTGMPTPDNSAVTRDFFAEVSYDDGDDGTVIHLTNVKWNAAINEDNEVTIEELTVPTASFIDDSEDYQLGFNFYVSGKEISFDVGNDGNLTISVDGINYTVEV